jgi:hypothetical protein
MVAMTIVYQNLHIFDYYWGGVDVENDKLKFLKHTKFIKGRLSKVKVK